MDLDREVLLEKARNNILPLSLGFLGLILLSVGVISSLNQKTEEITFTSGSDNSSKTENSKITIDVEGAITNPGVYSLETGGRVKEVLILAGGLSPDADRGWVEKNVNLAAQLSDGQKLYIPRIGDNLTSPVLGTNSSLININSASLGDLDSLVGIGPATAQKIVDNRPYKTVEDLVSKKVLSSKALGKIKERITAY